MSLLKKLKENLFAILVAAAYLAMFIFWPGTGVDSLKNSIYYIKEMLMIMPVVFVLTALLDQWVPKKKIMKYLGKESGARGVLFSLLLGSVSAGPVYAAFPLCVMLHKKGASVRNLVVILSAWAVIKIPMLLNEMKFLGLKFMAIRWILTVAAIVVFSWMTAKIVKDGDLLQDGARQTGLTIDQDACIGCAMCVNNAPDLFEINGRKASLKAYGGDPDAAQLARAAEACPVKAIIIAQVDVETKNESPAAL